MRLQHVTLVKGVQTRYAFIKGAIDPKLYTMTLVVDPVPAVRVYRLHWETPVYIPIGHVDSFVPAKEREDTPEVPISKKKR
jgi:hypothetical protein